MRRGLRAGPVGLLAAVLASGMLGDIHAEDTARAAVDGTGSPLAQAEIVVDTTSDITDAAPGATVADLPGPDGKVSLREAITAANNTAGPQVIAFNIPTVDPGYKPDTGVFVIAPTSALPHLFDDGTTIDGFSQRAFTGNTNPLGPEIVLDGSQAGQTGGININRSNGHVIRGLVIHGFAQAGIQFNEIPGDPTGGTHHSRIERCFIGTDETGTFAIGNGWEGIAALGTGHVIRRNLVSGNGTAIAIGEIQLGSPGIPAEQVVVANNRVGTDRTGTVGLGRPNVGGIKLTDTTSSRVSRNLVAGIDHYGMTIERSANNLIEANLIGTDASGALPLSNTLGGVAIVSSSAGNLLVDNIIAFNGGDGVEVGGDSTMNTMSGNAFFSNQGIAIDLFPKGACCDGVTPNDPGDADTGGNGLLNFPVIRRVTRAGSGLLVEGGIDSPGGSPHLIEFFATEPGGDPSGHGEGIVFLGALPVNPAGHFAGLVEAAAPGSFISATATDVFGNTSEFALNVAVR